ncbi:acyl-CoA dehydrogenase family protein [Streptosporangium sp. NPDC006007]|uniref:acyl-CoA dehydrogenase family protein n=1 Tax=Streptosporangium sp. NPDC006007 TaxID=3154575 RepID=UPI0033B4C407
MNDPIVLAYSEEQEQFRDVVRDFLSKVSPESEVRRLMETDEGFDRTVWHRMATDLGLQGLIIPEEYGGSGASFRELGVVLEQMGAALLTAPYLSTSVLATGVLLRCGDDSARADYLPGIASGETVATLALAEESGRWDLEDVETRAVRGNGRWRLNGTKNFVLDGHVADLVLVAARTASGVGLFAVDTRAGGVGREPLSTMDQTRKQARLDFRDAPARLIGAEGSAAEVLPVVLDLAAVALAAEQVGGARRCLEMSVAHAGERVQFGRPIGSFQAVKHKCADVLVEVESAQSIVQRALWAASEPGDDLPVLAAMAGSYCSDAYVRAAAENIQIHGAMGFSWEFSAHLYLKRAKSSELLLGSAACHRRRLAGLLGL